MYKLIRKLINHHGDYDYNFRGVLYKIKIKDNIVIYNNNNVIFDADEFGSMFSGGYIFEPEFIEKLLQSFLTFISKKENSQDSVINPEQEDKPIADGLEQISEDFHGGSESTASVEDSQSDFGSSDSLQSESKDKMIEAESENSQNQQSPQGESNFGESQNGQSQPVCGQPAEKADNSGMGCSSDCQSHQGSFIDGQNDEQSFDDAVSPEEEQQDKRLSFDLQRVYHNPMNQKPERANGGGSQFAIDKDSGIDARITQAVERLVTGWGVRKVAGYDHWWSKPVAKSIIKKDMASFKNSKYRREAEKIYLILDTSGSVDYLSEEIKKIALSCLKSNKIVVYTGSEAHPCYREPYKNNQVIYNNNFHVDLYNFLRFEKPSKGATIIFFGDLFGVNINIAETKKLINGYKTIWLCNRDKETNEWKEAEVCFNKVIYNVDTINKFVSTLRNII